MRFNDLLSTALSNIGEGPTALVTRWRQFVDLLAQYDVSGAQTATPLTPEDRDALLSALEAMRPRVSLDQRIASIVELGPRLRSPGLVRLLCKDHPSLVVTMMQNVQLAGDDWARIMAELGPLARSVLRRRTDLDATALTALRQFGEIDLALPSLVPIVDPALETAAPVEDGPEFAVGLSQAGQPHEEEMMLEEPSQIRRLVARIERFTEERAHRQEGPGRGREHRAAASEPSPTSGAAFMAGEGEAAPDHFLFETDASGVIQLTDLALRSAACGLSIAAPALDNRHGVDGTTLGAFRHRAAFEQARLTIGDGPLAGEWRISGEPHFDRRSGRFLGYTGSARREFPHEGFVRAQQPSGLSDWMGLSAATMRQLIHELRTPLNAMQGYGEMIEAQILGPVPWSYRELAKAILVDTRALLATFDDLDLASRIERGDASGAPEVVDIEAIFRSVLEALEREDHRLTDVTVEGALPEIAGDRVQVERMLSHLLRAGRAALQKGERLRVQLSSDGAARSVSLIISRPAALRDMDDRELLDDGALVEQHLSGEAPALGLAFTLKLVRSIVRHLGGTFAITPDAFSMTLPSMPMAGNGQEHNA